MSLKVSATHKYKLLGKEFSVQFKKPNIGQQLKIGQSAAVLKGGMQLDTMSEGFAIKVATLNEVIVDKSADLDFLKLDVDDWDEFLKMFSDYEKFVFFRGETPNEVSKT